MIVGPYISIDEFTKAITMPQDALFITQIVIFMKLLCILG